MNREEVKELYNLLGGMFTIPEHLRNTEKKREWFIDRACEALEGCDDLEFNEVKKKLFTVFNKFPYPMDVIEGYEKLRRVCPTVYKGEYMREDEMPKSLYEQALELQRKQKEEDSEYGEEI